MTDFFLGSYIALTIGLLIGNTPALIAAMYFSLSGHYNVWAVLICSLISTLVWDLVWYYCGVGLSKGKLKKISNTLVAKKALNLTQRIFDRHSHTLIFLFASRFAYGLSTAAAVAAGWHRVNMWLYIAINTASMIGWFGVLYALSITVQKGIESTGAAVRGISIGFPIFFIFMLVLFYIGRRVVRKFFPE